MSLRSVFSLHSLMLLGLLGGLASPGVCAPQSTPLASGAGSGAPPPADAAFVSTAVEKARAFASLNTHAPISPLGKLAVAQMRAFGAAMGVPTGELQDIKVADYGTYVVAVTDKWVYDADVSNNQCFRPVSALPSLVRGLDHAGSLTGGGDLAAQITEKARGIVSALGLKADLKNAICKKEQVLVAKCGTGIQPELYDGRNFVRLCDDGTFLHLICDSNCLPIRVDTNIQTDTTANLSKLLFQQLKLKGIFPVLTDGANDITFATFFSKHEDRFEINAFSFEGRQLPEVASGGNPYDHATQGSDWWNYYWWNRYGRVDGIRGDWNQEKGTWQKPGIKVFHHAMDDYPMIGRVNIDTNTVDTSFHRDLEDCTVGVFITHGGPIHNNFQIDSGKTWFLPGDTQHKYGSGNLRHLIFDTCGAMGFIAEQGGGGYKSLFGEWLPGKYVDGLRTACGNDGGSSEIDRDGWRFFSLYNKGESIETSWTYASIVECAQNSPATIAYAATPEEALTILTDGRFSKERSEPTYSVANVWREIK